MNECFLVIKREKETNDGQRKTVKWVCRCETRQERKLSPICWRYRAQSSYSHCARSSALGGSGAGSGGGRLVWSSQAQRLSPSCEITRLAAKYLFILLYFLSQVGR